jgi:hypothetical protein
VDVAVRSSGGNISNQPDRRKDNRQKQVDRTPFFPVIRADEHDAICGNIARYFCPGKTTGGRKTRSLKLLDMKLSHTERHEIPMKGSPTAV